MSTEEIRVVIAEDLSPLRDRFRKILDDDPLIRVVGMADSGRTAVDVTMERWPDLVLMDIEMEDKEAGLRASREILERLPGTKVVILTVYEEDEMVFRAFEMSVADYMMKNASSAEIVCGVKDAYFNRSPIRPVIAEKLKREFRRLKSTQSGHELHLRVTRELTHTELDTLQLLSTGRTRIEVCEIRNVELSTVKSQIHSILAKLGRNSIQDLVRELDESGFFAVIRSVKGE